MMDDLDLLRDFGRELEHEPPATLARQRDRHLRVRPRRRWTGWWTAGLVAVATALAVAVPAVLVGGRAPAPPSAGGVGAVDVSGALNVLLIGSDTRDGDGNARYGPRMRGAGARSDSIVIVHLPADRGRATAVSVPRDSMVPIPRCGSSPARTDMINSAYDTGGASCLRTALEKLTGLRIAHTVEVDFTGFKSMVDALGGVEVTLPRAVDDRASKLRLPAGKSMLNGEAALGYARLRHYGDGSDVARIKRQAQLLRAMLDKVKTAAADPQRLRAFLGEVRAAVRTDLDLEAMYQLADGLRQTSVTFVTVPYAPHPRDRNRLQWKQPEARRLFDGLR
ncbi:LCP family protein [Nonomuraea pusilla]|uniref:Transcriptional attenuator, LytR family n=1 Tax=Nonomuraea pusilla TaxID=46177 RepID=A0A1H7QZ63_9ACTN|nr:LCP family protein [Nonomuraea pusilla]SEL53192.1 transcriptional attenuator, LytR family [Nonomuraea pusilla]